LNYGSDLTIFLFVCFLFYLQAGKDNPYSMLEDFNEEDKIADALNESNNLIESDTEKAEETTSSTSVNAEKST